MMRQGANSAVRFSTYSSLKALFQGNVRSGQPLPSLITFGIGGVAGVVTVYTTMPLELSFDIFNLPPPHTHTKVHCLF